MMGGMGMGMGGNEILERIQRGLQTAEICQQNRGVLLSTPDTLHALGVLKRIPHQNQKVSFYRYSTVERSQYIKGKFETCGGATPDVAQLLHAVNETKRPAMVVFEGLLQFIRDEGGDVNARLQLQTLLSPCSRPGGRMLIFLETPEGSEHLPSTIRPLVEIIQLPMPKAEDLQRVVIEEVAAVCQATNTPIDKGTLQQNAPKLAHALAGLTVSAARNSLKDALVSNPNDFDAAFDYLSEQKSQRLASELSMRLLDTTGREVPIGLDNLFEYLRVHRHRIAIPGPDRAKGILLVGPPGTGKTMMAKAIGGILELPVVEFNIGSLMNSLLGETEHRFQRAFDTLDVLAPAVVFIDEFEKAFAGQGAENDGGTMMRAKGRLLSWLSDSTAPNFIVATANDLENLGQIGMALTRKGRFDRAFYVGNPCLLAREQIVRALLKDKIENCGEIAQKVAEQTRHFSGAELRALVNEAAAIANYRGEPLSEKHLIEQVNKNSLRVLALHENFYNLREWAKMHCEPAGPSADDEV